MILPSPLAAAPQSRIIKHQVTRSFPLWARSLSMPPSARLANYIAFALALSLLVAPLPAQSPQQAANTEAFGFTYHLPADWQIAPEKSVLPAAKQNAEQSAKGPGQVLSVACAQVVFSAHSGKPPSVIVVAALPFACYGQPMTPANLSRFAGGVSEGLKQNLDVSNPVYGAYTLGTHNFWIERAVGVPKTHSGPEYTVEIACTILKTSAVCWMTIANSAGALRDFENSVVALDGEPPLVLVPINAFVKKPLTETR